MLGLCTNRILSTIGDALTILFIGPCSQVQKLIVSLTHFGGTCKQLTSTFQNLWLREEFGLFFLGSRRTLHQLFYSTTQQQYVWNGLLLICAQKFKTFASKVSANLTSKNA